MKTSIISIFKGLLVCVWIIGVSGCLTDDVNTTKTEKKAGTIAIVFADLTGSINEEVSNKVKANIGDLFKNLPAQTDFYLYSIDKGTSKPDIYSFAPRFTKIETAADEDKLKAEIAENKNIKATTEFIKLNNALNAYHQAVSTQKGASSCLTNKMNFLANQVKNQHDSHPDYNLNVYFYSDMIEDCDNSFDGKALDFEKNPNDRQEQAHIEDITKRIDREFGSAQPINLKSLGAKMHVILTSQDDKQNSRVLKEIWTKIFEKFGYDKDAINDKNFFYWGDGTGDILWANRIGTVQPSN